MCVSGRQAARRPLIGRLLVLSYGRSQSGGGEELLVRYSGGAAEAEEAEEEEDSANPEITAGRREEERVRSSGARNTHSTPPRVTRSAPHHTAFFICSVFAVDERETPCFKVAMLFVNHKEPLSSRALDLEVGSSC